MLVPTKTCGNLLRHDWIGIKTPSLLFDWLYTGSKVETRLERKYLYYKTAVEAARLPKKERLQYMDTFLNSQTWKNAVDVCDICKFVRKKH